MTATPRYMTRWQIHPDATSQLCRHHCHRAPLAVWGHVVSRALSATRMFASTARIQSDEPPKPPHPIDDSTSALDYKTSNKVRPPPLPRMDLPRSRSAEEVVTNILYNTPPPSLQPYKK